MICDGQPLAVFWLVGNPLRSPRTTGEGSIQIQPDLSEKP